MCVQRIYRGRSASAPVRPGTSVTVRPIAQAPETERSADGERQQSLQSLERGMAVIQVFSRERPALTLSEVANLTGITRATARRILLTLEKLGHVRSDGRLFSPTPRLLTLGWAYLSSLNLSELALPLMETLVEETHESCSAATLDLPDVVYVARVPTRRIMSITLSVGTRLPAHCTSMGRVLLAALAHVVECRAQPVGVGDRALGPHLELRMRQVGVELLGRQRGEQHAAHRGGIGWKSAADVRLEPHQGAHGGTRHVDDVRVVQHAQRRRIARARGQVFDQRLGQGSDVHRVEIGGPELQHLRA